VSIFLAILSAVFVVWALFTSMNVWAAKQVAFAQVCQMLWAVVSIGLALMAQRASHRWADEGRREKREPNSPA